MHQFGLPPWLHTPLSWINRHFAPWYMTNIKNLFPTLAAYLNTFHGILFALPTSFIYLPSYMRAYHMQFFNIYFYSNHSAYVWSFIYCLGLCIIGIFSDTNSTLSSITSLTSIVWMCQLGTHGGHNAAPLSGKSRIVCSHDIILIMGLLPDWWNCGLRMRRECQEGFPRHRPQRKPLVSDPGMHHSTRITRVPWRMSGSLNRGSGENVPVIPGACETRNLLYLARGPLRTVLSPTEKNKGSVESPAAYHCKCIEVK